VNVEVLRGSSRHLSVAMEFRESSYLGEGFVVEFAAILASAA
jgi:hypothetical protein